jgi:hypothetical protein
LNSVAPSAGLSDGKTICADAAVGIVPQQPNPKSRSAVCAARLPDIDPHRLISRESRPQRMGRGSSRLFQQEQSVRSLLRCAGCVSDTD